MPSYEQIGYGSDDGAQFGSSTADKIGFYGATPIAKPSAAQTTTATTTTLRADVTALQTALSNLGLITLT
jgi:hypothetical protein